MGEERRYTLADVEAARRAGYELGYKDGYAAQDRPTAPPSREDNWRIQGQPDGCRPEPVRENGGW